MRQIILLVGIVLPIAPGEAQQVSQLQPLLARSDSLRIVRETAQMIADRGRFEILFKGLENGTAIISMHATSRVLPVLKKVEATWANIFVTSDSSFVAGMWVQLDAECNARFDVTFFRRAGEWEPFKVFSNSHGCPSSRVPRENMNKQR